VIYYKNGNYTVTIKPDGTKTRETNNPDDTVFLADFPETLDVKITDYCDMKCPYCHEKSTKDGEDCDPDFLIDTLSTLPRGIELAIGGGDPMAHNNLTWILEQLQQKGFICNMTLNAKHAYKYSQQLVNLLDYKMITGLGISLNDGENIFSHYSNSVAHVIVGIHDLYDIKKAMEDYGKVLILGYKNYGRGETYKGMNKAFAKALKQGLRGLMHMGIVSFDNLAIEQLGVRGILGEEKWSQFYMGDEGKHSMYFDAVKQEFARSSTSERVPCGDMTITEFFKEMQNEIS